MYYLFSQMSARNVNFLLISLRHRISDFIDLQYKNTHTHRLTVEFVDLGQVGKDAGQLIRVEYRPHLLEKDLVQDPQGPQVGRLGGEQL